MLAEAKPPFDPQAFLAKVEAGKTRTELRPRQIVFAQGDPADAVFSIRKGRIELKVFSPHGKEVIIAVLGAGDFFGEGCLTGQPLRVATAAAATECTVMRIEKSAMVAMLRDEPDFAALFLAHPVTATFVSKKILSTICSIRAKSAWRGCWCCWPIWGRTGNPKR